MNALCITKRVFLVVFLIFVMMPAAHAEKICTQMGCVNGLIMRPPAGMFKEHGKYEFQFFAGKQNITCIGKLPLKSCEEGPSFECTSNAIRIGENGCALPDDQHEIGDIFYYGIPRKVVVIMKRDGDTALVRTLRPTYVFTRPNGPGCDPQCVTSTTPLSTRAPND